MRIEGLAFDGFRNLKAGELCPGDGVNILYGDNGQGKTNLLEAIWLFTGGRSFRGAKDAEMVGLGLGRASLRLRFFAENREQEAEIAIQKRRIVRLNGIPQPSPSRLAGSFCAVVFSPVHLSLIKDGPEGRRRFLDAAYCQVRPSYIATLAEFSRCLAQRNALLKEARLAGGRPDALLDVWDARFAQLGARVVLARRAYVERIRPLAAEIYAGLSGGRETLDIALSSGREDGEEPAPSILQALQKARGADLAAGFTTAGPHRDDLDVTVSGLSARIYGSQGQQRSAVLALKLAEAALLERVTGEKPVALLDDVMSELDVGRQEYLLNQFGGWQVFITCCDPAAVGRLAGGRSFQIRGGELFPGADL